MTVKIQGKEYMEVAERLSIFREKHPSGQIVTEILSMESGIITMKASVLIDGVILATGHAQEKEGSTFINKTSYIENCETSAVGRALGIFGIGLLDSVSTANEVMNAQANHKPKPDSKHEKVAESNITWLSEDSFKKTMQIDEVETLEKVLEYYPIGSETHKMKKDFRAALEAKIKNLKGN